MAHAEWDLDEADPEGERYHITGVTALIVERGRVRAARDYIFDQPLLASIWPCGAATAPGSDGHG